jgi:hypothetical protein
MKKILLSVLIIGVVAAIAIGGTVAYYASSNNVAAAFQTTTFNVSADNAGVPLEFGGLTPGGDPVVKYMRVKNDGDVAAYIRATTGNWNQPQAGSNALLNALHVKVTLFGSAVDPARGGNYPSTSINTVSYEGPLVGLYMDNLLPHNNPILPGQVGTYKVEISLPFGTRDNSLQGTWAGCDVIFDATQAPGQNPSNVQW